jgi:predicted HTH domain antitoxin
MYKKRSKLVHEGKSSEITQEDVYALRQIVRECIVKLSKLNLEKEKLDTLLTYSGFGQFKS